MKCPYCGNVADKVVDSRKGKSGRFIRRRRECTGCGKRFTTYEYVEESALMVVKADGRREMFNRKKLRNGLIIACTKRPVSIDVIDNVVQRIEEKIHKNYMKEVDSGIIGNCVMDELKNIDEVAYVRFASVYRKFQDKEEFIRELNELKH